MMKILKKLFSKKEIIENNKEKKSPKKNRGFTIELEELKKKLNEFLLTSKVQSGIVVQRQNFSLVKNGYGLYKLEGTEKNGSQFSIIISTSNHLQVSKENKITGLIQISEAELNRAISKEHSSLKSILNQFKNLNLNEKALEVIEEKNKFNWKEILLWDKYYKEMLLLKLNPNIIALLLISEGESFKNFFLEIATKKQKQIISDELFFLNQGVNSEEMNPNSKNLNLYNFDLASSEFKKKILEIKKLIEKD